MRILLLLTALLLPATVQSGVWEPLSTREEVLFDFTSLTPTPQDALHTNENNIAYHHLNNADWYRDETPFQEGWHYKVSNTAGGSHANSIGYKYIDFTDQGCYFPGTCMQSTTIGGTTAGGSQIQSKVNWLANPQYGSGNSTGLYMYIGSVNSTFTSNNHTNAVMQVAVPDNGGRYNRMVYYIHPHPDATVFGVNYPRATHNTGPYSAAGEGVGGHWYHHVLLNGGGIWKTQLDGHPHHNNIRLNNLPPMDQSYIRNYPDFFSELRLFYIMSIPLSGYEVGPVPYRETVSPFIFWEDTEPQNEETITGLSTMWNSQDHFGEMSFESKYLDAESYGLYQLRYSFTPITNANWNEATPVHVREYGPFHIDARTDGVFIRPVPGRKVVWVRFDLATGVDEDKLEQGSTIYYAVKDIGQVGGNSPVAKTGAECLGTYYNRCGTDYAGQGEPRFDYTVDAPELLKIKRISYSVSGNTATCGSDPDECLSQTACEAANWYWYTSRCHASPQRTCAEESSLCVTRKECVDNGYHWLGTRCSTIAPGSIGLPQHLLLLKEDR